MVKNLDGQIAHCALRRYVPFRYNPCRGGAQLCGIPVIDSQSLIGRRQADFSFIRNWQLPLSCQIEHLQLHFSIVSKRKAHHSVSASIIVLDVRCSSRYCSETHIISVKNYSRISGRETCAPGAIWSVGMPRAYRKQGYRSMRSLGDG